MSETMLREGPMRLLLFFLPSLVLALLLFLPAERQAAKRTLRLADHFRGILPVIFFPAAWDVILLLAGKALLAAFGAGKDKEQVILYLLPLAAGILAGYPVLERGIRRGYQRTTPGEIETARTLGFSEKMIRKKLLAARSRGETIRALVRTIIRIFAELLCGSVTASVLLACGGTSVLVQLGAIVRDIFFWEALGGSLALIIAAEFVLYLTRRGRRHHGT
ncbi:MAG: hypothetical protein ACI4OJ_02465 [Lachnospiraceae bacterium]